MFFWNSLFFQSKFLFFKKILKKTNTHTNHQPITARQCEHVARGDDGGVTAQNWRNGRHETQWRRHLIFWMSTWTKARQNWLIINFTFFRNSRKNGKIWARTKRDLLYYYERIHHIWLFSHLLLMPNTQKNAQTRKNFKKETEREHFLQ